MTVAVSQTVRMPLHRWVALLAIAALCATGLVALAPAAPPAAAAPIARTEIGAREETGTNADFDEFTATAASPVYVVGTSGLSSVRDWIGHSMCGGCTPGTTKTQVFELTNLTVGETYVVGVHPTYITGSSTYSASIVSGTATIPLGASHTFRQTGYLANPESWQIEITPATTTVRVSIGNGLTSGTHYMAVDWYVVGSKELRVPAAGGAARIGQVENFTSAGWDEFTSASNSPTHTVGSGTLSTVRQWIGHSSCPTCGPGTTKTQNLSLSSLVTGQSYWITVYPAFVNDTGTYSASVSSGSATIASGGTYSVATTGYQDPTTRWAIKVTASSSNVTISLGNSATSGDRYLYFNWIDVSPEPIAYSDLSPSALHTAALALDTGNGGDWYKNDVENGGYMWYQGYIMDTYVGLYRATLDEHWLEKLVDHADSALAQRDSITSVTDCYGESAPAWKDSVANYVWVGFTGALFDPMMNFAKLVLENPTLGAASPAWLGGGTLADKARDYVADFQSAVDYHESEWVTSGSQGWYKFQNDLASVCGVAGGTPLQGQPAAYDMNALMMGAVLKLADAYRADGDPRAATYQSRAVAYGTYFKSVWSYSSVGDKYTWGFAAYYPGTIDDIGHANFNVKLVVDMHREGLVFTRQDVTRVGNMVGDLILPDSSIPFNEIDGVYNSTRGALNNPIYYMGGVAPGRAALTDEIGRRHRLISAEPGSSEMVSMVNFLLAQYPHRF